MSDQYEAWRNRLEALTGGQPTPPVIETEPDSGYYRIRYGKSEPWQPVVIWRTDSGDLKCVVGRKGNVQHRDPCQTWVSCAKNPIGKNTFRAAFETGKWPDVDDQPLRNAQTGDPVQDIIAELENIVEITQAWDKDNPNGVTTKEQADIIRNREARVGELLKEADKLFETEKKPALEAARAIDQKFNFRKNIGDPLRKKLKAMWGAFAAKEEKRLREEAAKKHAEEVARVEAERKRIEAERAKQMDEDPIAALTSDEPELPEMPAAPEVKVNVGGAVGAKGGLKTKWIAVVTDYKAAAEHFHDHGDMKKLIDKLAQRTAAGTKKEAEHPGFKVTSERVAS